VVQSARERARAEVTKDILDEARRQLAADGAPALSLRAVARQLGMASSALYRYFASRDELLTALIVEAYDDLGEAVERAERQVAADEPARRWRAVCQGVRRWALAHPHQYALLYGSPVPGYRAPERTVGPAARVPLVLSGILSAARAEGSLDESPFPVPEPLSSDAAVVAAAAMPGVPTAVVVRGLVAWTQLFGIVSFELFGHTKGVVSDGEVFFAQSVELMGRFIGLSMSLDEFS
jgi:AcrR family transcriptional regulator